MISRIVSTLILIAAIFIGTRAMIYALPGDPLDALIAESGTSIPREELKREMGLDRPFFSSVIEDTWRFAQGDLGHSLISKQPLGPVIGKRFENTFELSSLALFFALSGSLLLGISAAAQPGRAVDRFCTFFGSFSAALPQPWIGSLLIIIFTLWLPALPFKETPILPALTIALGIAGYWSRLIRNRVRESLNVGAAQAARARGIPEWKVRLKYGFAPVSGALIAYLGGQVGVLLAGTFVVEMIYDRPGMGSFWIHAVLRRDYPAIEAATFIAALSTLIGILIGNAVRDRIDPREGRVL